MEREASIIYSPCFGNRFKDENEKVKLLQKMQAETGREWEGGFDGNNRFVVKPKANNDKSNS